MRKVKIEGTGKNMTTHAELIPAMRFLAKLGFRDTFHKIVRHTIGSNARYQLSDAVELNLFGLIAGARSVDESIRVRGDKRMCKLGGWLHVMDPTTMGRIFKTATAKHVYQMEAFNHVMRGLTRRTPYQYRHRLMNASADAQHALKSAGQTDDVYLKPIIRRTCRQFCGI